MILLKISIKYDLYCTYFLNREKYRGEAIAGFHFYDTPWHFGTQMKPFSKSNIKVHPCMYVVVLSQILKIVHQVLVYSQQNN